MNCHPFRATQKSIPDAQELFWLGGGIQCPPPSVKGLRHKDSIVWELGRQVYVSPLPYVKYYTCGSGLYLACFSLVKNHFVRKLNLIHNKQKFVLHGKLSICAIKSKINPNKVFIFLLKCTINT